MILYSKIPRKYTLDDCDRLLYFTGLGKFKIHSVTLIYFKEHYNTKNKEVFKLYLRVKKNE